MTSITTPSWGDIADNLVQATFVEKQRAMILLAEMAMAGDSVDAAQIARNFSDGARGAYLWSHYLEAVENNPSTPSKLTESLSSLRTQIGESPHWAEKATKLSTFAENNPSLKQGFFEYDIKNITTQLGQKFGSLFPEFISKLSVTTAVASLPIHAMLDYKVAAEFVKPLVENHTLTAEAGRDYADVVTKIKLMQAAIMDIEPTLGYPLFKEWADKYHVSHDTQVMLDPTGVSKSVIEFAPEA